MIKSKKISLMLQKKTILDDVSCHIPKGKITMFIGNSGGGKTSLLKCMATLYQYQGDIACDGADLTLVSANERAQSIGFVFQQFHLFGHMTVLQNCMHPMQHVLKISKQKAQEKALEILMMLGMVEYKDSYPKQLSGGQQQRVAIARALCLGPKMLLLDEPTSALDPKNTKMLQELLQDLCKAGITIALSSHDMMFVKAIADMVYFIEDGKIVQTHDVAQSVLDAESKIGMFLYQGNTALNPSPRGVSASLETKPSVSPRDDRGRL